MNEKSIKVVSILSPYKVVINNGSDGGIKHGQKVLIFGCSSNTIIDPETGKDLGKLEIVRGRGRVSHVQNKISTVESIEKDNSSRRVVKNYSGFQAFMGHAEEETIINNELKPFDEVQIGDYVRIEE